MAPPFPRTSSQWRVANMGPSPVRYSAATPPALLLATDPRRPIVTGRAAPASAARRALPAKTIAR